MYSHFLCFGLYPLSVFLKSLKNLKNLTNTTFLRMDIPRSCGFTSKRKMTGRRLLRYIQQTELFREEESEIDTIHI
jgi:hypothetical protein